MHGGEDFVDEYGCDYECRTVGDSITKYNIPDGWFAEFDAYDGAYPIVFIPVDQIRNSSAMMDLNLKIVENKDGEYAGCMVLAEQKTIAFKVDHMIELIKVLEKEW